MFGYDLKQAFGYIKQDKQWKGKIFGLVLYNFLSIVPVLGIFTYLMCIGYLWTMINRRIVKPSEVLPDWSDKGNYIVRGLQVCIYGFLMYIIPLIIVGITLLATAGMDTQIALAIRIVVICSVVMIFSILWTCGLFSYSTNLKFGSFFKAKAIKFIIFRRFDELMKFYTVAFIIGLIFIGLFIVTAITFIIPIILMFYMILVCVDLQAQAVRKIFAIKTK